ncbi:MAG: nucleotidyltransferase family protein [Sphingomonas sp.]|nr:nucleotidyltransferase family protein [Sphingomonas sp.]
MRESAEFRLAAECCRANFAGALPILVARPTPRFNWPLFLDVARYHRIEGLVWNALSQADFAFPNDIHDDLSKAASAIAARNVTAMAECVELRDAFARANVPLLFLKGIPLGAIAYVNPALKASVDIDLLIAPADLLLATKVLRDLKYQVSIPSSDSVLARWHRRSKESVWVKDQGRIQIDLHTRAADNPSLIPWVGVHSPTHLVRVAPGLTLPTLDTAEQFAYLAVHGGTSTWFRLKWISDFAGFLSSKSPEEIGRLYRRSQELGAGRAADQGLLLADRLFGTLNGNGSLRDELLQDRLSRYLMTTSLALLWRTPSEPTERFLGTLPLHLNTFLLKPGLRYKLTELAGQGGRLLNRFAR